MTKLHIFDMDGTLLRSTASVEISRSIGAHAEATTIERDWLAGQISGVGFWERCLTLWETIDDTQIGVAFESAPWMQGVADVFADIAARGEHSVVITQSPQFFVDRLLGWGAEKAYGTRIILGGSVRESQLLSADDKVKIVIDLLNQYRLEPASCVAYGDSTSDVPLFEWLPHTVAINASDQVKQLARTSYDGVDLRTAYSAGRSLLHTSATQVQTTWARAIPARDG